MNKRILPVFMLLALSLPQLGAQTRALDRISLPQGSKLFWLSSGFVNNAKFFSERYSFKAPSVELSGEYGLFEWNSGVSVGIGTLAGYARARECYTYRAPLYTPEGEPQKYEEGTVDRMWTRLYAGPSVSVHYAVSSRIDVYVKPFFCVDFGGLFADQEYTKQPSALEFNYGVSAGAAWFFGDRFGVFAESGFKQNWLSCGIVMSFGGGARGDLFGRTPKYL